MQKNPEKFSMQEALRLAQSDVGQQLLAHLNQRNDDAVHNAMEQASSGNYEGASRALSSVLNDPEIKKLIEQLGGMRRE